MTHVSATPRPDYSSTDERLSDSSLNLLAQIERSHALLTLLSLVDPDRLSDVGIGFDMVTQEVLATLEQTERYLAKEKRIVEMFCESTRERP